MATAKEREQFIALMVAEYYPQHSTDEVVDAARLLLRHARTHGNLAVQQCNGPQHLSGPSPYNWQTQAEQHRVWINGNTAKQDEWETQRERKELACEKRIKDICAQFNLPVTLGGDPRGYTVKVKLPSGAYNTWGGSKEGYGVPQ